MATPPDPPAARVELDDVVVTAGARTVLDRVHLTIGSGITAVVGPSGSGKSTLLRLLNRLDVPDVGIIRLDGVELGEIDPPTLRRRVAMVFQRPLVFPGDVHDNLTMVTPGLGHESAVRALGDVGLPPDVLHQDASTLSGGEAQRLALARVLLNEPEVVLADEVTSMLDPDAARAVEDLLIGLARTGTDVVMVSHDGPTACRIADRIVVLVDGSIRAAGTPSELAASTDPVVLGAIGARS